MRRKQTGVKALHFNALFYEPTLIEAIGASFDTAINITEIYAKEGALGTGASRSDPISFAGAFSAAAKMGGKISVIGTVQLKGFSESAHSAGIQITGADKESTLRIDGIYTLGGETTLENITLAARQLHFPGGKRQIDRPGYGDHVRQSEYKRVPPHCTAASSAP